MAALDFNTLKKKHLTVTLPDENRTVLMVSMPTKRIMDEFLSMQNQLTAESLGDNAIDELYEICAKVMSHNKMGKRITKEKVMEVFDFEDIIIFIRAYSDFINEVISQKN